MQLLPLTNKNLNKHWYSNYWLPVSFVIYIGNDANNHIRYEHLLSWYKPQEYKCKPERKTSFPQRTGGNGFGASWLRG